MGCCSVALGEPGAERLDLGLALVLIKLLRSSGQSVDGS